MRVTEILENFQNLLSSSIPFLLRVGIEAGNDAWDDYLERAFAVAVAVPLEEEHASSLRWTYGTWVSPTDSPQLIVTAARNTPLWVGTVAHREGAIEVAYAKKSIDAPLSFAFREFGNPFMTDPIDAIRYVTGEVVRDDQPLEKGVRVCVPFEPCEFSIA